MQSIYIFSPASVGAARQAVAELASPVEERAGQWLVEHASECALFIQLEPGCPPELSPEEEPLHSLVPRVESTLVIDVSRRGGGRAAATELAVRLLHQLGGVAQDDHSERLWTAEAILSSAELPDGFAAGYG